MSSSSSFFPSSSSEDHPSSSSQPPPSSSSEDDPSSSSQPPPSSSSEDHPSSSSQPPPSSSSELHSSSSSQPPISSSSSYPITPSSSSRSSTSSLGDVWFLTQQAYVTNPFAKNYPPTEVILRSTFEEAVSTVTPQINWITVEGIEEISETPEGKDYKVSIKASADQSIIDDSGKIAASLSFDINLGQGKIENAATEIGAEKTFSFEAKKVGSSLDWSGGIKATLTSSVTARITDLFGEVDPSVIGKVEGSLGAWFDSENFDAAFEFNFNTNVDLLSRQQIASMELSAAASASLKTPPAFNIIYFLISGSVEGAFQPGLDVDPAFNGSLEFGLDSDTEIPLLDFIIDHFKMRIDFIGPDGRVRFDIDHPSFIFRFKKEF